MKDSTTGAGSSSDAVDVVHPHHALIASKVPEWLSKASPATRRALRNTRAKPLPWLHSARRHLPKVFAHFQQTRARHRLLQQQVDEVLATLPAPELFAEPLLRQAITDRFNTNLDVRSTYLHHARRVDLYRPFSAPHEDPLVLLQNGMKAATPSLLDAALQNFEAWETEAGAMDYSARATAAIYPSYPLHGLSLEGAPLNLAPHDFAALCRELDFGARYQALIDAAFNADPASPDAAAPRDPRVLFKSFERASLELHAHIARMKGNLDEARYRTILEAAHTSSYTIQAGEAGACSGLTLWGVELHGIVLIHFAQGQGMALYIPDDPLRSLTPCASLQAAHDLVRDRLLQPGYQAFFNRFIPARQRSAVAMHLAKVLQPKVWNRNGYYEQITDPQAQLRLGEYVFSKPILCELFDRKVAALKDDGLFQAVPTAEQDRLSAAARWHAFENGLLNVLNVAAFVVPVLGQIMMAVTAVQLCYEVYEGIDSLLKGEKEQAWDYLLDVAENVALIAGLGGAMKAAGRIPVVEVPDAVSTMRPVTMDDGQVRLCKPDMAPFAHERILPPGLLRNAQGLYEYEGKQWLAIDDRTFSVKPDPNGQGMRVEHPHRPDAYQPRVRQRGDGVWLHEFDEPRQWQTKTLLRRLGVQEMGLTDERAMRALRVSGETQAHLRKALASGEPLPALAKDSLKRFAIDSDLQRFIEQVRVGDPATDVGLQLELLNELGGAQSQGLVIPQGVSDIPAFALGQLGEVEVKRLLGEEQSLGPIGHDVRVRRLRQQMADLASARRAELFNRRYAHEQWPMSSEAASLRQRYPELPAYVADELVHHSTALEKVAVREGDVPARIAREIRAYLQHLRTGRACEGLYFDTGFNPDSQRLVLHSLERLPGWSRKVRLEVRDGEFGGPLLGSIGGADAPIRKVVVRQGEGYRAYDGDGRELHGEDDLYRSILQALPDTERQAIGLPDPSDGKALRQALQKLPLPTRRQLRRILGMPALKAGFRSPMRLADGRIGYPLSGRGAMAAYITEESLLDKLRLLDMSAVPAEDLLNQLQEAGLGRAQIDARLNALLEEQAQLRASLDQWTQDSLAQGLDDDARAQSRERIAEGLWHHWQSNNLPEIQLTGHALRLRRVRLGDFPAQLPDFVQARVQALVLQELPSAEPGVFGENMQGLPGEGLVDDQTLGVFLRRFQHVTSLEISSTGAAATWSGLPRTLRAAFPALRELRLNGLGLVLWENSLRILGDLGQLEYLDLSGNRLFSVPPDLFERWNLRFLGLNDTGLQSWPLGLDNRALAHVAQVSLEGNALTSLPLELLDPANTGTTRIRLQGNPLPRPEMVRARSSQWLGNGYRFELPTNEALAVELLVYEGEFVSVRDCLDQWAEASSSRAPLSGERRAARHAVAQTVGELWREQLDGNRHLPLRLDGIDLDDFPGNLPGTFRRRIQRIVLAGVHACPAALEQFLRQFPMLRDLTLEGHATPLTQLPQALTEARHLTYLSLFDQGLQIDQAAIDFFARLRSLRQLVLSRNRLGVIDNATALAELQLQELTLDGCSMQAWPNWLDTLVPGRVLLLSLADNQLATLPEHLLENARSDLGHTEIDLRGNPLEHETLRRAYLSEVGDRSFSFNMDVPDDIRQLPRPGHDSELEDESSGYTDYMSSASEQGAASVGPWLDGALDQEAGRRELWHSLVETGEAQELLGLVDSLRSSADYRTPSLRSALVQRVWRVLEAASEDTELRLALNGMAEEPLNQFRTNDTCADGIRLEFNQMEVQVFTRQALRDIPDEQRGVTLYRLTRQLYRLQELDNIAREQAGTRDEAEVRLAYRLHWAREFDLPLPPGSMLFRSHADLRPGELDQALHRVQAGEHGQPFLDYAQGRDFWVDYLRERYRERFEQLKTDYEASVLEVTDHYPDDTPDQTAWRIRALEQHYQQDVRRLIEQLTLKEGMLAT